jgi:protein gp37
VLTKRSERLLELHEQLEWPRNVWMGVSVESARYAYRADHLRGTNARVKFLSVEPLLGPLPDLSVEDLDWVIVGGESGRRARPMELDWARQVRDKCVEAGVAFFLKQLGGRDDKRSGDDAVLDGRTWREYPKTLDLEPYPNREATRAGRGGNGDVEDR